LFPKKFQGKEQSLTAPLEQRRQAALLEVQAQAPAPFWGTLDNELSFQLELNLHGEEDDGRAPKPGTARPSPLHHETGYLNHALTVTR